MGKNSVRAEKDRISGYWLSFTDEEKVTINEGLQHFEFTPDMEGLKGFVIAALSGDDPEFENDVEAELSQNQKGGGEKDGAADRVLNGVESFVRNNPDTVARYGHLAKGLATHLFHKFSKLKTK